jgi:hypothetical protein
VNRLAQVVAFRVLALLDERRARINQDAKAFWVWPREDRIVIIFDPSTIDMRKVNEDFAHGLSTRLQGRVVKRTNTRGMFLQIGYDIPPMLSDLRVVDLDLSKQVSPFEMPVGMSGRGEMWISLLEGDSFLVSGTRKMGKSGFLHGWMQALLHGGKTLVYGYDGKSGVEFVRYIGRENFHYALNLADTLRRLLDEAARRRKILLESGCPNVIVYNQSHMDAPIMPIALFIDEAALTTDEEKASLVQIVERERDTGIHPILGTNRPEASALLVKTNLATRICFAVPSWNASQMVLGMNGAEKLPKSQGRGLIVFGARVTEFQAFMVSYPKPSDEALELAKGQMTLFDSVQGQSQSLHDDLLTRALELREKGMSITGIVNDLFGSAGGAAFYERSRLVREALGI